MRDARQKLRLGALRKYLGSCCSRQARMASLNRFWEVGRAAFAIFGRLVVGLRKPRTERLGGDVERIFGLVQEENPFLLPRERRRRPGNIVYRLIVRDYAQDAVVFQTIGIARWCRSQTKAAGTAMRAKRVTCPGGAPPARKVTGQRNSRSMQLSATPGVY